MLSELVYLSFRSATCTDEDVEKILEQARRFNGKQDITGVLVYSKDKFLQVLEGEQEKILSLYEKIKLDKRHDRALMVANRPIMERHFPSWQMAQKAINTDDFSFLSEMTDEEQTQFKALLNGENQNNATRMIARLFV